MSLNKIFCVFLTVLLLCTGCSVNEKKDPLIIGSTEFDGQKITFYYEEIMEITNVYFSSDFDNVAHSPTTSSSTKSKDGNRLFYVDFSGIYNVLFNDEIIEPVEIISFKNDKVDYNMGIYHLESDKEYYKISKNVNDDYFIVGCVSSETGKSAVCDDVLDVDGDELLAMVDTWEVIEYEEIGVDWTELKMFLSVQKHKTPLESPYQIFYEFKQAELENGTRILCVSDGENHYYRLTKLQSEQLDELLNK